MNDVKDVREFTNGILESSEALIAIKMKRKAALVMRNGEIVTTAYIPTILRPDVGHSDIKEILVLGCTDTDEAAWMQSLEDTWGVATLDMAAGKEKYPELYI